MTDAQFGDRLRRVLREATQRIQRELARNGDEAEVRKRWREEEGLIFVREYTVKAHAYRRPKQRRRPAHALAAT